MEKEHLHLLINEEIYLLSQDETIKVEYEKEKEVISELAEPELETIKGEPKETLVDETRSEESETETTRVSEHEPEPAVEKSEEKEEIQQESPHIPIQKVEEPSEIPFAIFHSSIVPAEHELLQKIIDACKIPAGDYKIFSNGFDQSVQFKKALVFVPEAKAFYSPIPYKGSAFLCSKPLVDLAKDQAEKAKLWGALQKFI
ncbi:hypothetical protein [Ekhidna sp.]